MQFISYNTQAEGERELGKVKVKCTFVQALRLCTGRLTHRRSRGIGKGKVHRCTGTGAMYKPYGA